ncbi:MAG: glycosyltransferase, partial [Acidobacteria bacterium]|nr:glycosyltransferase [Acidobacteriota bacterium]
MVVVLYLIAVAAIVQGLVALVDGYRAARHMEDFRPRRVTKEKVVVFCPCKGVEEGLHENVRSLLEQDYENYEVRFVVESDDDPAYAVLVKMGVNVVVAGRAENRGQKVHNLAVAVQTTPSADILVFCDSDARYPRQWLSTLISPVGAVYDRPGAPRSASATARSLKDRASLQAETRGHVTTGYRWYLVERFHLPTLFRSAWNASVVSMRADHNRNFAWGGSMA